MLQVQWAQITSNKASDGYIGNETYQINHHCYAHSCCHHQQARIFFISLHPAVLVNPPTCKWWAQITSEKVSIAYAGIETYQIKHCDLDVCCHHEQQALIILALYNQYMQVQRAQIASNKVSIAYTGNETYQINHCDLDSCCYYRPYHLIAYWLIA